MGIGIVLLAAAVVGTALAAFSGCVLGIGTYFLTRTAQSRRWPVLLAACVLPFACLVWGGVVFGFQAIVNENVLNRDAGLGDAWRCPLPNGYSILMIDTTDHGWIFNPKTQNESAVGEQEDAVSGVQELQLSGPYILGVVDKRRSDPDADNQKNEASYFILDTKRGTHTGFANHDDFQKAGQGLGIASIRLEPISVVYRRYRYTWFDGMAALLFFVPPLIGFAVLTMWVLRTRKHAASIN